MATLAELEAHKAALEAARGSGELRIRFADGRETAYRSIDEIDRALGAVTREIAAKEGKERHHQIRFATRKGW